MTEIEAQALLARNQENFQIHLKNHFARGGTATVKGIPRSKRAEVDEILNRITLRLRDW